MHERWLCLGRRIRRLLLQEEVRVFEMSIVFQVLVLKLDVWSDLKFLIYSEVLVYSNVLVCSEVLVCFEVLVYFRYLVEIPALDSHCCRYFFSFCLYRIYLFICCNVATPKKFKNPHFHVLTPSFLFYPSSLDNTPA